MAARLIDGKQIAASLLANVKERIDERERRGRPRPSLAVILIGDDPASAVYVRNKTEACRQVGVVSVSHIRKTAPSEAELLALITELNEDASINGILLQLPLPPPLRPELFIEHILPAKDVDGFHPYNMGRLAVRRPALRPCTPAGVMTLLHHTGGSLRGLHAVVVGASNHVGRPMGLELLLAGCTVTTCHRFTTDLRAHVASADILIAAAGKPALIPGDWIKEGAIVIDIGMNRLANGRLVGDIDFAEAQKRAAWITPVPGGVGPMTVATLLANTLEAATLQSAR
ncbi:bifunctional methylenetetrahydrofolate dehydrogenase/methenyltetrahydrofolate cyclohydrolase FolD [Acidiferrobacter sp.]|uniref:bifunctional methylenetetrahydrofolate dehydrogenase/methenyltetrahydrofolate cyclohydrolase FolD n=1 Tax=Acidiferrobacter sp. TaxID=1872107 RepID=UPI0026051946|nr:bifunctional methylenetetrahydrofolate dehydrogenase/methenyltetrahydrofolate cyclohydrolase FolD [Acidiferrobacter sp.]